MKVIAFAASNSRESINKALVSHAADRLAERQKAEIEVLDLNDFEMPLYSLDRENEQGIPAAAHAFREKIGGADVLLISFAEHNGSYTAAYKNLFDWTSRINPKVYQNKQAVILATSPGPGGAQNVLASALASAPYFNLNVKGSLSVPSFYDVFDVEHGLIKSSDLSAQLDQQLSNLD